MINIRLKGMNELFMIEAIRNFDFLIGLGYQINNINLYRQEPGVSYLSKKLKREIIICMPDPDLIVIDVYNRSFSLKKNNININQLIMDKYSEIIIPGILNEENLSIVLKKYSDFILENLSSIIEGKEWI